MSVDKLLDREETYLDLIRQEYKKLEQKYADYHRVDPDDCGVLIPALNVMIQFFSQKGISDTETLDAIKKILED